MNMYVYNYSGTVLTESFQTKRAQMLCDNLLGKAKRLMQFCSFSNTDVTRLMSLCSSWFFALRAAVQRGASHSSSRLKAEDTHHNSLLHSICLYLTHVYTHTADLFNWQGRIFWRKWVYDEKLSAKFFSLTTVSFHSKQKSTISVNLFSVSKQTYDLHTLHPKRTSTVTVSSVMLWYNWRKLSSRGRTQAAFS